MEVRNGKKEPVLGNRGRLGEPQLAAAVGGLRDLKRHASGKGRKWFDQGR